MAFKVAPQPLPPLLCIFLHQLSQVFLHSCDSIIQKKEGARVRKRVLVATPCTLRLLFFYHRLLFLCSSVCDAILYFSAVWAACVQLTTVPHWIKSADYKNIQKDQTGFQESLNQSKVKTAEREASGYLQKERRSRHWGRVGRWVGDES